MPIDAKVLGRLGAPEGSAEVLIRARMAEKPTVPPEPPPANIPLWSSFGYTSASNVVIASGQTVLLDGGIADCNDLTVQAGGTLLFSKTQANHLRLRRNFIVEGLVEARTTQPSLIQWVNINEAAFVGGHTTTPLTTDPGLWVQGHGDLRVEGKPKTGWLRANAALSAGATTLTLASTPVGWEVGDEICIVPTLPPTSATHWDAYDIKTIATISGAVITWTGGLTYAHPSVTLYGGTVMTPEVLNLTRSFRIEGEAGKRAHIIINGHTHDGAAAGHSQTLKYFAGRYLGPQKAADSSGNVNGFAGRYGLHIHQNGEGSRGTLVEGVVMRDLGNIAYVPHGSHGVTFRDCVLHNGYMEGYWWDPVGGNKASSGIRVWANASDDTLWDKCVASRITVVPSFRGTRASLYHLSGGINNRVLDSVAVGNQQGGDAAGMMWPEGESADKDAAGNPHPGVDNGNWAVEGFVSHNNKADGLFVWQNTPNPHRFTKVNNRPPFIAYHNGQVGWEHGAYQNGYQIVDAIFHGNKDGGLRIHALSIGFTGDSKNRPIQTWERVIFDGGNISNYGMISDDHTLESSPVFLKDCRFRNHKIAHIFISAQDGKRKRGRYEIVDPIFEGTTPEFYFDNLAHIDTTIVVRSTTLGNFTLRPKSWPSGTLVVKWNAKKLP